MEKKKIIVIPVGESHPHHGYCVAVMKEMIKEFQHRNMSCIVASEIPKAYRTSDIVQDCKMSLYEGFLDDDFNEEQKKLCYDIDILPTDIMVISNTITSFNEESNNLRNNKP